MSEDKTERDSTEGNPPNADPEPVEREHTRRDVEGSIELSEGKGMIFLPAVDADAIEGSPVGGLRPSMSAGGEDPGPSGSGESPQADASTSDPSPLSDDG
jgi:hypothetical protein